MANQVQEVAAGERFEFGKNWSRFLANLAEPQIEDAVRSLPVSYTHLDVYKRQPYTVLGLLGMFISAAFIFRTGSRGGFLAVIGAIVAVYFTIRQASTKFKMLALLGVLGLSAIVAAAANPIAFKRLTDIALADQSSADSQDVLFANSSQMAREAVSYTHLDVYKRQV